MMAEPDRVAVTVKLLPAVTVDSLIFSFILLAAKTLRFMAESKMSMQIKTDKTFLIIISLDFFGEPS